MFGLGPGAQPGLIRPEEMAGRAFHGRCLSFISSLSDPPDLAQAAQDLAFAGLGFQGDFRGQLCKGSLCPALGTGTSRSFPKLGRFREELIFFMIIISFFPHENSSEGPGIG